MNAEATSGRKRWVMIATALAVGLTAIAGAAAQPQFEYRPLTQAEEALFPSNAPIDDVLVQTYGASAAFRVDEGSYGVLPGERVPMQLVGDATNAPEVCRAYLQNAALYGGAMSGGCNIPSIHPRLATRKKFQEIIWTEVDPRQNLAIIRSIFIARQKNATREFQSESAPNYLWHRMGPIVRLFFAANNVRLRKATFDVDNDGVPEEVFALALQPNAECFTQARRVVLQDQYYFIEKPSRTRDSFNAAGVGGTPIVYDGRTYFVSKELIISGDARPTAGGAGAATFATGPDCEFSKR